MPIGNEFVPSQGSKSTQVEANEYEPLIYAKRVTEIPSNMQLRADYDSQTDGKPKFLGFGPRGLASSSTGWLLQQFTYDASRQVTLRQVAYNTWDNRASATYA